MMLPNWLLMLTGGVFLLLIPVRTRTEEDKLVARFGDSYREYMQRTGRFVPNLGAK